MGVIVSIRKFSGENQAGLLKPIIYCCSIPEIEQQALSLNKLLAEQLAKFKPKRRSMQVEKILGQLLADLPDDCTVKDFDVLFNPDYTRLMYLQVMINVCKVKPFSVIWPGRYDDGKLYYAEEGYD
jgi:hypothetical protein